MPSSGQPPRGVGAAPMLAARRRELIRDRLHAQGGARVAELADLFGVSDMTIRRDLDALADTGVLEKVHGGATLPSDRSPRADEPGFAVKVAQQMMEKAAIGASAARRVQPGSAIGLTAGTTTYQMARSLDDVANLVVITNSMRICEALLAGGRADRTVLLTGGQRTPSDALVGPLAIRSLSGLHLDQVFMGVHGMSEAAGFTTPNLLEADTNRAFMEAGGEFVVLADHSKWGIVGLAGIAHLGDVDCVVTDELFDPAAKEVLAAHAGEVVLAPLGTTP